MGLMREENYNHYNLGKHLAHADLLNSPQKRAVASHLSDTLRFTTNPETDCIATTGTSVIRKVTDWERWQENGEAAVKLSPIMYGKNSTILNKIEAQTMENLSDHPSIPRIYSHFIFGEFYAIAMEYFPETDKTLNEHIQNDNLTLYQTIDIITQLADVVDHLNKKGVFHRDLKPLNIILQETEESLKDKSKKYRARVFDLGICSEVEKKRERDTSLIFGTPNYISPERAQGFEETFASEVYSLGIIGWEMLTKYGFIDRHQTFDYIDTLFAHVLNDPQDVLNENYQDVLDSLRDNKNVDTELLQQVMCTALAKEPTQRYQTATEFARAFEAAISPNG